MEIKDELGGYMPGGSAGGGFDEDEKKVDPTELKDTSVDGISSVFKALVQERRQELAAFRPTLEMLDDMIDSLHAAGIEQVSLEHADFDKLRAYNIVAKRSAKPDHVYCILSIYDTQFILRVYKEDNRIDLRSDNINKAQKETLYIDTEGFWYEDSRYSKTPKFYTFKLTDQEDTLGFINTIVRGAATCAAHQELKEFDKAPPKKKDGMTLKKGL